MRVIVNGFSCHCRYQRVKAAEMPISNDRYLGRRYQVVILYVSRPERAAKQRLELHFVHGLILR
jgi:hypothetical protein